MSRRAIEVGRAPQRSGLALRALRLQRQVNKRPSALAELELQQAAQRLHHNMHVAVRADDAFCASSRKEVGPIMHSLGINLGFLVCVDLLNVKKNTKF